MDFTGKPMKGFVFVSTKGLTDTALEKWLDMCIDYVSTLKASRRKPKRNIEKTPTPADAGKH